MVSWIKFFLEAINETSKTAKEKFKKVVEFTKEIEDKIVKLPTKTDNVRKVIDLFYDEPSLTRNKIVEKTGINSSIVKNIVNQLVSSKIIKEVTGYSRNQVFTFEPYADLFLK